MPSAPAIRIDVAASRTQRIVTIVILAAAALSLAAAPWPSSWRVAAIFVLALLLVLAWHRRRAHPDLAAIEWRADGGWWLRWAGSDAFESAALVRSRVFGPVIALAFDAGDGGRLRQSILWPDSADGDVLRRLRVRLARAASLAGHAPRDDAVR